MRFRCYWGWFCSFHLADPKLENFPVGTRDIDSLIPRKVPEISKKNIAKYLNEAGFTHVFKDGDTPATESFVKEIGFQSFLGFPVSCGKNAEKLSHVRS